MTMPHVAYLSMEIAVDQALKTYAGGLGFLAGSHMRSAHELDLNMVGVSILWSYGYFDQTLGREGQVKISYHRKFYDFLEDTGVLVPVNIRGQRVLVKALLLRPERFGTVPIYFLTTDIPENLPSARSITHSLYDADEPNRLAQEMVLGMGGYRALEAANLDIDLFHMNEGHALPVAFEMLGRGASREEVRKQLVFTTHTPVKAGNEVHDVDLMLEMGFFGPAIDRDEAIELGGGSTSFGLTPASLCLSRKANAVSKRHGEVAREMWESVEGSCEIISITNAQNQKYWQDAKLREAAEAEDFEALLARKRELKIKLFERVADECGKLLDPDVCTMVWARRFADYKRAWLPLKDKERLATLLDAGKLQILWAGKPHPNDTGATELLNWVQEESRSLKGAGLLVNYDLGLSKLLKQGSDLWLNTPRRPKEASGTSGMTAAMNGSLHFSTQDGWHLEYCEDGINGFNIGPDEPPTPTLDEDDYEIMMSRLENEILPLYQDRASWARRMHAAMTSVIPKFGASRMAREYVDLLYKE
jgi:starch phosphorylase